jgi:hypothetical protein
MCGPKREEVPGAEGNCKVRFFVYVYSSSNVITMIKTRMMKLGRRVARKGKKRICTGIWWLNLKRPLGRSRH